MLYARLKEGLEIRVRMADEATEIQHPMDWKIPPYSPVFVVVASATERSDAPATRLTSTSWLSILGIWTKRKPEWSLQGMETKDCYHPQTLELVVEPMCWTWPARSVGLNAREVERQHAVAESGATPDRETGKLAPTSY